MPAMASYRVGMQDRGSTPRTSTAKHVASSVSGFPTLKSGGGILTSVQLLDNRQPWVYEIEP